jgi:glycosyltransferase involved in cell wall biosynthesis
MRIVLYTQYFMPQLEYMENAFAREFARRGHEVIIVTTHTNPQEKFYKDKLAQQDNMEAGYRVIRLSTKAFGRNKTYEIPTGFLKTVISLKPDLIFFQSLEHYITCLMAVTASRITKAKLFVVVNEHFTYFRDPNAKSSLIDTIKPGIEKTFKRISLKAADRVIGMNEYSAKAALEILPEAQSKTVEIHLGVDPETVFFKSEKRAELRERFNFNDDELVLVHSGKLFPEKKTHLLIEAAATLSNPKVKVLLVGNGPQEYVEFLKETAFKRNFLHNVTFVPAVKSNELHYYYCASDIAVWPDLLTISTIEASAVGIPVVVPDYHGYEHRTKYDNGFKIKPGDLSDLTDKLKILTENENLRKEMGERARQLVEKELNWKSIVDKIFKV